MPDPGEIRGDSIFGSAAESMAILLVIALCCAAFGFNTSRESARGGESIACMFGAVGGMIWAHNAQNVSFLRWTARGIRTLTVFRVYDIPWSRVVSIEHLPRRHEPDRFDVALWFKDQDQSLLFVVLAAVEPTNAIAFSRAVDTARLASSASSSETAWSRFRPRRLHILGAAIVLCLVGAGCLLSTYDQKALAASCLTMTISILARWALVRVPLR